MYSSQNLRTVLLDHLLKQRIQSIKKTGDSKYSYQNEPDKVCFQHDTAYGDFKDLPRRIAADKVLRVKHLRVQ